MSDKELKATLEAFKAQREQFAADPEKARAFLIKYGFITPDGQLHPNYR